MNQNLRDVISYSNLSSLEISSFCCQFNELSHYLSFNKKNATSLCHAHLQWLVYRIAVIIITFFWVQNIEKASHK